MFHIVLFEPEIPPNTGNIMRLVANTGCRLHLIEPLGFELEDKQLRRADVVRHQSYEDFTKNCQFNDLYAFTTKAKRIYSDARFAPDDALLFGPESRGLPAKILESLDQQKKLKLPMVDDSRSLNLSNTVSIALYEAWRQQDFAG